MKIEARLVQRHNDNTDRKEWALISKKSNRILKWFGPTKPSDEAVQKEERRVQFWKSHSTEGIMDERFLEPDFNIETRDALPMEGPWYGYDQPNLPLNVKRAWAKKELSKKGKKSKSIVDPRWRSQDFRHDSVQPVDQTYGWGLGQGVATEINPFSVRSAIEYAEEGFRMFLKACNEVLAGLGTESSPVCVNIACKDLESLRDVLPEVFAQTGLELYKPFYAALQSDGSLDVSEQNIKPGYPCQFFHYDEDKLMDSMEGQFKGDPMEKFESLTDLLEWIIPVEPYGKESPA